MRHSLRTGVAILAVAAFAGCAAIAGLDFEEVEGPGGTSAVGGAGAGTGTGAQGGSDGTGGGAGGGAGPTAGTWLVALQSVSAVKASVVDTIPDTNAVVIAGSFAGQLGALQLDSSASALYVAALASQNGELTWSSHGTTTGGAPVLGGLVVRGGSEPQANLAGHFSGELAYPPLPTFGSGGQDLDVFALNLDTSQGAPDGYLASGPMSDGDDVVTDVALTESDSAYLVTGVLTDELQLGSDSIFSGGETEQAGFVARVASGVTEGWLTQVVGVGSSPKVHAAARLGNDHAAIVGTTEGIAILSSATDPTKDETVMNMSGKVPNGWVAILDPEGTPVDSLSFDSTGAQHLADAAPVDEEQFVVIGRSDGILNLPLATGGDAAFTGPAAYVARFNDDLTIDWVTSIGGSSVTVEAVDVYVPTSQEPGYLVVGGSYGAGASFGLPVAPAEGLDGFVAGYALSDGAPQWVITFGGANDDVVHDVAVDGDGDVVAVGEFASQVSLGNQTFVNDGANVAGFVAKFPVSLFAPRDR